MWTDFSLISNPILTFLLLGMTFFIGKLLLDLSKWQLERFLDDLEFNTKDVPSMRKNCHAFITQPQFFIEGKFDTLS